MFILIVEPEVGKMDAVYNTLRDGYQLGFVKSKEDAIKLMATNLYDFVILDYVLLEMTGEEFQRALRLNDSKAKIIFTFQKATETPMAGLKDCKWLGVPFDAEELLNLLK